MRDDKRGEQIFSTILRQGLSLEDPAGFTLDDNLNYRGSPSRKQGPLRETLLGYKPNQSGCKTRLHN
jgi:hypothetical protein